MTPFHNPLSRKAFRVLNVHACDALVHGRLSASGARWRHTHRSISPGWNAAQTSSRTRRRAALALGGVGRRTAPCPLAELRRGTSGKSANRKCSVGKHIPPRCPAEGSCRCHSCSSHAPTAGQPGAVHNSDGWGYRPCSSLRWLGAP